MRLWKDILEEKETDHPPIEETDEAQAGIEAVTGREGIGKETEVAQETGDLIIEDDLLNVMRAMTRTATNDDTVITEENEDQGPHDIVVTMKGKREKDRGLGNDRRDVRRRGKRDVRALQKNRLLVPVPKMYPLLRIVAQYLPHLPQDKSLWMSLEGPDIDESLSRQTTKGVELAPTLRTALNESYPE